MMMEVVNFFHVLISVEDRLIFHFCRQREERLVNKLLMKFELPFFMCEFGVPKRVGDRDGGDDSVGASTVIEIGVTVHMCTTGMPALSISFTIVAPQRVQVPQVDVDDGVDILEKEASRRSRSQNAFELATDVLFPTVE